MRFGYYNPVNTDKLEEIRTKLTAAFKAMRKQNLVARRNFMCCGGCASTALNTVCKAKDKILGAVYYTQQGEEAFRKGKALYLNYGGVESRATDEVVGTMVRDALNAAGVEFEWSGNPAECIKVIGAGR